MADTVSFSGTKLTRYGANRIAGQLAGNRLIFTTIALGSGHFDMGTVADATELANEEQRLALAGVIHTANTAVITGKVVQYANNPEGFKLRELGLYVQDDELGLDQLFAVACVIPNGETDFYLILPPNGANYTVSFLPKMAVTVGLTTDVMIDQTTGSGSLENIGSDDDGIGIFAGIDDVTQHFLMRRIKNGAGITTSLDANGQIVINCDPAPQVGDCYEQKPWDRSPQERWPDLTFEDISPSYAGYFLSVLGGNGPTWGAAQGQSVPNGSASHSHWIGQHGFNTGNGSITHYGTGSDSFPHETTWTSISLSQFSDAYGANDNTVRPKNRPFKIWRRTGTIEGEQKFYKVDEDDIFIEAIVLKKDEAGFIGLDKWSMLDNEPPTLSRLAKTIVVAGLKLKQVSRYNRTTQEWELIPDTRGLTVYDKNNGSSRNLFKLDQPTEDETFIKPKGDKINASGI